MVSEEDQTLWGDLKMATRNAKPLDLPDDPRFEHRSENVNGINYHYLFAEPKDGNARATVVLVSNS
jgi:hypothetical protein